METEPESELRYASSARCGRVVGTARALTLRIGPYQIPTWSTPLIGILFITFLIPRTSLLGHLAGAGVGYLWGLGYAKFLVPPEKALRWIEGKLNLLGRLPHYVSVDQKTYGRYGVLDSREREEREDGVRLGP